MPKKPAPYITKNQLKSLCPWLTENMIKTYLPPLRNHIVPNNPSKYAWDREKILKICEENKTIKEAQEKYEEDKLKKQQRKKAVRDFVDSFTPERKFEYAAQLDRRFVLHIGPTNSGKTYSALEKLKEAETGVYLGPLRLLALEVFDKLNADGIFCSLLTGEETLEVPFSNITASTIEMANFSERYDVSVAVIS